MSEIEDKTAALLAALWVRNLPLVEERVATLEAAAVATADGGLGEELRKAAHEAAHKLAGSVGMYGYDEGTRVARLLEHMLDPGPPEAGRFGALVTELRAALFPVE